MPTARKSRTVPEIRPTNGLGRGVEPIRFYGWDSRSGTWHGPSEPGCCGAADKRLLRGLERAPGKSWFGSITCGPRGEVPARFFVLVHDLRDCGVASIYCDESKTGPAEIVVVIPAGRRAHLREDFAFELLAFARFLGAVDAGAELQVHDAIAGVLAGEDDGGAVVFSLGSGSWPGDLDHVLSCCVERVAVTVCRWLEAAEPAPAVAVRPRDGRAIPAA